MGIGSAATVCTATRRVLRATWVLRVGGLAPVVLYGNRPLPARCLVVGLVASLGLWRRLEQLSCRFELRQIRGSNVMLEVHWAVAMSSVHDCIHASARELGGARVTGVLEVRGEQQLIMKI